MSIPKEDESLFYLNEEEMIKAQNNFDSVLTENKMRTTTGDFSTEHGSTMQSDLHLQTTIQQPHTALNTITSVHRNSLVDDQSCNLSFINADKQSVQPKQLNKLPTFGPTNPVKSANKPKIANKNGRVTPVNVLGRFTPNPYDIEVKLAPNGRMSALK